MEIKQILVNHMTEPIGFQLDDLRIEFKIEAPVYQEITKQLLIWTKEKENPVYISAPVPYTNNYFDIEIALEPRTRYHVEVIVKSDEAEARRESFFETGKMTEPFQADWIAHPDKDLANTVFQKKLTVKKDVRCARLYMTGLGLYEVYLDNRKVGDEYLAPGVTDYTEWIQIQTYDVTEALAKPAKHEWRISTADGWYKGEYGFEGGRSAIYGDHQKVIAELYLEYADGSQEVILTDSTWLAAAGNVTASSIYYGEDLDDTLEIKDWQPVVVLNHTKAILEDRLSLPIKIQEKITAQTLIHTPAGEEVLDFGQNQVGWLSFYNREPKGTKITFQMGEILQEDNFYRDNLRDARAAFTYISDGEEKWVRPHFTYYGYRYVKIEGHTRPLELADYEAHVMYSDMPVTGGIKTGHAKVDRLFENILWGQKGNFFDVPTDCPQRDERLGWTGDAAVFSNTAALNMDVFAFFKKYMKDVAVEQKNHGGMVTMYAPAMGVSDGGAAVWGDAATIIPWNMYQIYGDPAILRQNYRSMKDWVNWVTAHTKTADLWTGTFQFGDWIALDGENPALPTGKTDEDFIASVYYYHSSNIIAQTAALLGYTEDELFFREQTARIKAAIQKEYITANGRLSIDTQTAYALVLYFELVPQEQMERVLNDLVTRLDKDNDHLKTGFVGTPFICQVLSKYGRHDLAMKIFMLEDFPSWLYAVNMGATTVWERWNSVQEDGTMHPDGMNSLNHYSIGAIMEWAYRYLLGLREHDAGCQEIHFAPNFDYHLKRVSGHFDTPYGDVKVAYAIETDKAHTIKIQLAVPFGVTVHVELPRSRGKEIHVNDQIFIGETFDLTAGSYEISYVPNGDYIARYHAETPAAEIMADAELVAKIDAIDGVLGFFKADPEAVKGGLGRMSLTKLNTILPFINIEPDKLAQINQLLAETPILSERN